MTSRAQTAVMILSLLGALSPATARGDGGERGRLDAAVARALRVRDLEAASFWRGAGEAERYRDLAGAERLYRRLAERLPDFSPAHRRVCQLLWAGWRREEALVECRLAVRLEPSDDNLAALAAVLAPVEWHTSATPKELAEAASAIQRARPGKRDDVDFLVTAARVGVALGSLDELRRDTGRLAEIAPDRGDTHYFLGVLHAFMGRSSW